MSAADVNWRGDGEVRDVLKTVFLYGLIVKISYCNDMQEVTGIRDRTLQQQKATACASANPPTNLLEELEGYVYSIDNTGNLYMITLQNGVQQISIAQIKEIKCQGTKCSNRAAYTLWEKVGDAFKNNTRGIIRSITSEFVQNDIINVIFKIDENNERCLKAYIQSIDPNNNSITIYDSIFGTTKTIQLENISKITKEVNSETDSIFQEALKVQVGGNKFTLLKKQNKPVKKQILGRERSVYVDKNRFQYVRVKGTFVSLTQARKTKK